MKNKMVKITYIFIIFGLLIFNFRIIYAVTEEELESQISDIDEQIDETYTEIAGLEDQMSNELEQINRLNIQIKEIEDEISETEDSLEQANAELEEKELELEEAIQNYNKQKEAVEARLVAIYESSKTTYLDVLFGADDITDFISKYYLIEQIVECDNELLDILETEENKIQEETDEIEEKQEEAETVSERLSAKQGSLEVLIEDKTDLISRLSDEELELQEQLEQFEEDKKAIEEELEELAKQNAIKASVTPSECGYISPLLGKTASDITTGYYGYSGHTGVDFAVASGTEVLAVKSGTVVISEALKNSNGSYRSYGEYVVIDHHDGTMTLYAHGLADSRTVQEGDEVEAGQVIMLSGSTRKFNWTAFTF